MNTLKSTRSNSVRAFAAGLVLAQTDFSNVTSSTSVGQRDVSASINQTAVYGVLALVVLLMVIAMIVAATREKRTYVEQLDSEDWEDQLDEPVAHHVPH